MNIWSRLFQKVVSFALCIVLLSGLVACGSQGSQGRNDRPVGNDLPGVQASTSLVADLREVSPPIALDDLKAWLDRYQPQVSILSPRPNQTLAETALDVELSVENLEIFQDQKTGLGPHLHLMLDHQASQEIYDLEKTIHFENLTPGTHTLQAFALYPWDESFKNAGAFAQVTFNVLTSSDENNPVGTLPLMTYNQPQGIYGGEPVLLDFYLTNAPLQTRIDPQTMAGNRAWQIRVTVNGQSFTLDRWQSIYLSGMKPGTNWVRLELLDSQGRPIDNAFNTVTRVVDYQPGGNDTRSRLFRGELTAKNVQSLLSRNLPDQLPPVKATPAVPTAEIEQTPEITAFPKPTPSPEALGSGSESGDQALELPLELEEALTPGPDATPESGSPSLNSPKPQDPLEAKPNPSPQPLQSRQRPWQKQFSRFWGDRPAQPSPETRPLGEESDPSAAKDEPAISNPSAEVLEAAPGEDA